MLKYDFISQLHCPYCGSALRPEPAADSGATGLEYGVLHCACYRYPVVAGIAMLRQRNGVSGAADPISQHIEAGDRERALHHAFYLDTPVEHPRSLWQSAARRLGLGSDDSKPQVPTDAPTLKEALGRERPAGYAQYLLYRHANNSFLAAWPLLLLLERTRASAGAALRVLDLNCGIGHASFAAQTLIGNVSAVATDHDFVNLFLARRYMIPGTPCLCLDAEAPLPFADGYFDAAVCMDGLHYVRSKRALLKELDRSVKEDGIWVFPHLHNALHTNTSPGTPLAPCGYRTCFEGFPPARLLAENDVFREFMTTHALDLSGAPQSDALDAAPVLSVVASRRADVWSRDSLEWPAKGKGALSINPIYEQRPHSGGVHLRMRWPNPTLERECAPVKEFLPEEYNLDGALWGRIQAGPPRLEDGAAVEELVKRCVLVALPPNYV